MMAGRKVVLEIKRLKTQFHLLEGTVKALDGIDLTILEKESVGIVGETGCGKSMTAFSILRLVPHPGKIEAGNMFFLEPPEVRSKRVAYEAEAQAWYDAQPLKVRQELTLKYGGHPPENRKGPKQPPEKLNDVIPLVKAPHGVVMDYMSKIASKLPGSDKIGRQAALRTYDLLNKNDDQMRKVRGKQISMIFQDPSTSLDPVFTIGSQLKEVISLHQGTSDEESLQARSIEALRLVRIAAPESVIKLFPHELSGGMKQRVMIALALSCNPTLLIADEPTTALDVTIQAQILNLLKDLIKRTGSSMMLITHNLGVVAESCDRICIMYAGRIVEDAETFELFAKPLHPYTKGLLMAFPKLGEQKEELSVIRGTVPNLMKPFKGCSFADRCDFATDKCRRVSPEMMEIEPRHFVSCHLYPKGGE